MEDAWLVSHLALWIFVVLQGLLILVLLRETATLLRRVQAVRPLAEEGLDIGASAPPFTAETLDGESHTFPQDGYLPSLLVFISPTCRPCQDLIPAVNEIAVERAGSLRVFLLSTPEREPNLEFARRQSIGVPLLVPSSGEVMSRYKVAGTPFIYLVDPDWYILSRGFASSKESLEGLVLRGLQQIGEGVVSR